MVLAKVINKVPRARSVRPAAAEKGIAAWAADCLLRVGTVKGCAGCGERVNVWRAAIVEAVSTQLRTEVVYDDVKDGARHDGRLAPTDGRRLGHSSLPTLLKARTHHHQQLT